MSAEIASNTTKLGVLLVKVEYDLRTILDDVLFDVTPEYLVKNGFREYFSSSVKANVYLQDFMYPPANAELVFMGCGKNYSESHDVGVIATPDELFMNGFNLKSVKISFKSIYFLRLCKLLETLDFFEAKFLKKLGSDLKALNSEDKYDYEAKPIKNYFGYHASNHHSLGFTGNSTIELLPCDYEDHRNR